MQVVIDALNWICGLGPMCMMPIIMFVIGICLRVKIGTLLKCCITTGVGFCGVNLVINTFVAQVGPSVQNMVARFGLHTDIMDVGWPARAAATWAYPLAAVVVFVVLGINILMLVLKATNCVMVDFWSYNHFIFCAAICYYASGSAIIGLICGAICAIVTFKLADWTQPVVEEEFGLPGVSFPTSNSISWAPLAYLLNKVYDHIPGLNKLKADPESIQKKFGVLGEPLMIGTILGAVFGILGGNDVAGVMTVAMYTAATMVLTPKMMQVLMEGLHLVQPGQTALDHIQGYSQNLSHLFHSFGQQASAGFKELHHVAKDAALGFRGIGGELTLQKQVQVLRRFVRGSPLRQIALLIRRLYADGPLDRAVDLVQVEQGIVDLLFFQHLVQSSTVQGQDVQGLQLLL